MEIFLKGQKFGGLFSTKTQEKKNKPEYDSAFVLSLLTQLFHFMQSFY